LKWGGIVVLENGRVFGGDPVMAYLGTYEIDREQVSARVPSWTWNFDLGEVENVFGMTGAIDYVATLEGRYIWGVIEGELAPEAEPQLALAIRMEKLAELP
jgi:hypothetical protein